MSYYYPNAILGSKILIALTILIKKLAQKLRQKHVSAKVAETRVETCFCQNSLNRFKPRFNRCWQKLVNTEIFRSVC